MKAKDIKDIITKSGSTVIKSKAKSKPEEKCSQDVIKEFFLQYAKDDKLFKTDNEEHQMIFTAGFIRGVTWLLKKDDHKEEIREALKLKREELMGEKKNENK